MPFNSGNAPATRRPRAPRLLDALMELLLNRGLPLQGFAVLRDC